MQLKLHKDPCLFDHYPIGWKKMTPIQQFEAKLKKRYKRT